MGMIPHPPSVNHTVPHVTGTTWLDKALDRAWKDGEKLTGRKDKDGCILFLEGQEPDWKSSRDWEGAAFTFMQRTFMLDEAHDGPVAAA
jgi:hypothetical protein